ncbi:DNA-binding transcription factor [Lithospermum erythrorhizon]|uniref:DNA-binding transcription factor n=1 Tax=Lithospermum erythrorhizon TaxID=34254 RepID=A0AAV3RMQ5_LITER
MENMKDVEQMSLVDILKQGGELSNQLIKNQMNPLTSKETCEHLIQKILLTYDKTIACLNSSEVLQSDPSPIPGLVESPDTSAGVSPKIGNSHRDVFKKRKTMPRWNEQIKVCSGTGLEGPIDDGHSWRKYGQKVILGATHPRAYYRCTHKYTRGCVATKQVQKTEEDPLMIEVTYRGKHTCMDVPNSSSPVVSLEEKSKDIINNLQQKTEPKQLQNIPFKFEQDLKVETEEINPKVVGCVPSFSFPSPWTESENQDIWEQFEDNNILAKLIPPATSESNYFSMSTFQVLPFPHGISSEISDMITTPTSVTNSFFDKDMDSVEVNFEPNLPFDVLDYFTTCV